MITTAPEPVAEPWTVAAFEGFLAELMAGLPPVTDRPTVLAVDGRSASGKSTLALRIAAAVTDAVVVHTDDVAWWESFFGWDALLAGGVLRPPGAGRRWRSDAWEARGREGAILVPGGTRLLVVEGVGASRRSLAALLDAALWVQSDTVEARRRGLVRDGQDSAAEAFWDEWDAQEVLFLAADRPWERALAVVCGTPEIAGVPFDPRRDVLVGAAVAREDLRSALAGHFS